MEIDLSQKYLRALKLTDLPNFEELDPTSDADKFSFVSRSGIGVEQTKNDIIRISKLSPDQVLLLSASPGVGKSTFVKFLKNEMPNSEYMSLFDYSPAFEYNFNINLTNHHIIRFASHLEKILVRHRHRDEPEDIDDKGKLFYQPKFDQEFEVDDYVIEVLGEIIKDEYKDKLYIFIDNVDFIGPAEQFRIIRIIGSLSNLNKKVTFIISGRPFITMMARIQPRQFFGTATYLLTHLPYLKIKNVVQARFLPVTKDDSELPEFLTSDAFEFLEYYIDGNIALGLKILVDVFLKRPFIGNVDAPISTQSQLTNIMMGDQLLSVQPDELRGGNFGFVVDILSKIKIADKIPLVYFILVALEKSTLVNDDLLESWNSEIISIDRQGVRYSNREFRDLLEKLRGMRLVRRVGLHEKGSLMEKIPNGVNSTTNIDCIYRVTRTGVMTIELAKTDRYKQLVQFSQFPTGYRDYFRKDRTRLTMPDESLPWLVD